MNGLSLIDEDFINMEFNREWTIRWLEWNQSIGFFEGFPEDHIDFKESSEEELENYWEEWVIPNLDIE